MIFFHRNCMLILMLVRYGKKRPKYKWIVKVLQRQFWKNNCVNSLNYSTRGIAFTGSHLLTSNEARRRLCGLVVYTHTIYTYIQTHTLTNTQTLGEWMSLTTWEIPLTSQHPVLTFLLATMIHSLTLRNFHYQLLLFCFSFFIPFLLLLV